MLQAGHSTLEGYALWLQARRMMLHWSAPLCKTGRVMLQGPIAIAASETRDATRDDGRCCKRALTLQGSTPLLQAGHMMLQWSAPLLQGRRRDVCCCKWDVRSWKGRPIPLQGGTRDAKRVDLSL